MITTDLIIAETGWETVPDLAALCDRAFAAAAAVEPAEGTVSLLLADDAALHQLNRDFRGKDKPTDVLSFPAHEMDRPLLGDSQLCEVRYEELVADVEGKAQEVVAFLGLAWESQCLRFHASDRVVRTASHDQVRKPVYGTSIGRWKKYERWLGPLRNGLDAPWPGRTDPSGR